MTQRLAGLICGIVLAWAATAHAATYTWTNKVGGAQSWANGLNWSGGSAPSPTTNDTVDFSTKDILADTTLTLDADRTATTWKFGDTSGLQNWIVNSGNTMILAGATPTINVVSNGVTLNAGVAGTAGLTKSGVGVLTLSGTNTFSGSTTISAGLMMVNGGMVTNTANIQMTGSSASLIITNGAQVTDSKLNWANTYIGSAAGANSNSAIIVGATWGSLGQQDIIMGNGGRGNRVMVGNGGILTNFGAFVGYPGGGSFGNYMIVTNGGQAFLGPDSLYVGDGANSNWVYVGSGNSTQSVVNGMTRDFLIGGYGGNVGYNNLMTVDQGGIVTNVGNVYVGCVGSSNSMIVANGGQVYHSVLTVGKSPGACGNSLSITNGGRMFSTAESYIGYSTGANSNGVLIAGANGTTNSLWNLNGKYLDFGYGAATGNWVRVASGGVLTNVGLIVGYPAAGSYGSYMIITNGGKVFANGGVMLGDGSSGGNWVYVGSAGTTQSVLNGMGNAFYFGGQYHADSNNRMTVDQGGIVTNVGAVYVGFFGASAGNSMVVNDGGQVFSSGTLSVGTAGSLAPSNTVTLMNGALLECNGVALGNGAAGNTLTNNGGILQFTTANPTVTDANSDAAVSKMVIANGTVSYRLSGGVVNLTDNWADTGTGIGGTNVVWSGNNALRLNNSTATNSVAAGYVFANNLGATNYTRLELVNGTNVLTGTGVTIDGVHGGSLVLSNTVAVFRGGLILSGGAILNCGVRADGTCDQIQVTGGTLSVAGGATLNVSLPSGAPATTYTLMDWSQAQGSEISASGITVNCNRPCNLFVWGKKLMLGVPSTTYIILK